MSTQLVSIQDFAKRDGNKSSREWVKRFSEKKFMKGQLVRAWNGTINKNFTAAVARVDYGRWVAECPFCGGSCMVDPDDPFFFCLHCSGNGSGEAGPVTFPVKRDEVETAVLEWPVIVSGRHASKAEEALHAIPAILPRNWKPGQTTDDLRKQHEHAIKAFEKAAKHD